MPNALKSRRRKRIENALSVGAIRFLRAVASAPPHRMAMRLASWIGVVSCVCLPWWRKVATRQLTESFPEWDARRVRRCTRAVFVSFAKTMFEFMRSRKTPDDTLREIFPMEGMELVREGVARGKGVIILAAHYDNWEWCGRRIAMEAGAPFTVIVRSQDDERLTRAIDETRMAGGLHVVDRDDVRGALRALRRGEILGIVPDQNVVAGGCFVDFFGRPAATALGPARFAAKTGAAVFHCLSRRRPDDTHLGSIFAMAEYERSDNPDEDAVLFTKAWTQGLEAWIREAPEQWMWFHKRWRTQPAAQEDEKGDAAP
jgi:Kdo2-lipid IVA lauroyltransferase/acyltransferase